MNNKKSQHHNEKPAKPHRPIALLTGIAFQMAAITGLGAFIGIKLDEHFQNADSLYTIIGTFIGFAIAMYGVIKQAKKLSR